MFRFRSPSLPYDRRFGKPSSRFRTFTFACVRAFAGLLIAGSLAAPAGAEPLELHSKPVPLNPNEITQSTVGALEYLGGLELRSNDTRFGGLSGLEVSADGREMIAVSDRGHWITARLEYGDGGILIGVADARIHALRDEAGNAVGKPGSDAEEIARLADGTLVVSFECRHRVWAYDVRNGLASARARPLPMPRDLGALPGNGGIEALTRLADGRLLAVSEEGYVDDGTLRGWLVRVDGNDSRALAYAVPADFHPTSFARMANGDILALERRFTLVAGPGARLVRIAAGDIAPGATLAGRELARLSPPVTVDNMEGLALRRDADGSTIVYLVSDDNFMPFQRTLLLQFRLHDKGN